MRRSNRRRWRRRSLGARASSLPAALAEVRDRRGEELPPGRGASRILDHELAPPLRLDQLLEGLRRLAGGGVEVEVDEAEVDRGEQKRVAELRAHVGGDLVAALGAELAEDAGLDREVETEVVDAEEHVALRVARVEDRATDELDRIACLEELDGGVVLVLELLDELVADVEGLVGDDRQRSSVVVAAGEDERREERKRGEERSVSAASALGEWSAGIRYLPGWPDRCLGVRSR